MKKVFALVLVSMFALVIGCGGSAPATETMPAEEMPATEAPATEEVADASPDAGLDEGAEDAGMDGDAGMDDAAGADAGADGAGME